MNSEIKMSVSSVTRTKDNKAIYVLFEDGKKSVEIALPGCGIVRNNGFSKEEINRLADYVRSEQDNIYKMAKEINPVKALMGKDKRL